MNQVPSYNGIYIEYLKVNIRRNRTLKNQR